MKQITLFLTLFLSVLVLAGTASEKVKHNQIKQLAAKIRYHDQLYWKGTPEISDAEYDQLVKELAELRPDHPLLNRLGNVKLSDSKKVKHCKPMLSLKKVYSEDNLFRWIKKVARTSEEAFMVQPKYDGVAADFRNNVLSTRGNGQEGYDISHLLPVTMILKSPQSNVDFRGELIMDKDNFKALNHYRKGQGKTCCKTPRSAVVSALQRVNLKVYPVKLTLIDYMYYTHFMKAKDFRHNWQHVYSVIRGYPFPLDGIVIKLSDQKYAESLGATEHHPRSMVAFKFASPCNDSIIRRVRWQFAAKGLIPVAEFDIVQLGGRNVRRATLHNAAFVKKNDICIGDTVQVKLSGDSIPKVTLKAKGNKRQHALPEKCPECNEKLVMKSIHLYCPNKSCPGMIYGRLRKELQRNRISGLGDITLLKLIKVCGIKNKDELAALNKKQLQQVPGITGKRAEKLYAAIQAWWQLMSN